MIPNLIYDIGMNNGDDTAYYLHKGYNVLAVEADPELCSKASMRFKDEVERGHLTILNIGIASEPGTLDFWICETNSEWNSFDRDIASREGSTHHSIRVTCQTLDWILKKYGTPYYLKVDIEGNDAVCVDALHRIGNDLPHYISAELGDLDSYIAHFQALGYTGYKVISQYNFLPLQWPPAEETRYFERWHRLLMSRNILSRTICKALGRERLWHNVLQSRRHGRWTFPEGSSGPFGEDTLGRWLTVQEVRDTFRYYTRLFEQRFSAPFWTTKGHSFWVDLHVRRAG
jgi:FkbM family methyltransferase